MTGSVGPLAPCRTYLDPLPCVACKRVCLSARSSMRIRAPFQAQLHEAWLSYEQITASRFVASLAATPPVDRPDSRASRSGSIEIRASVGPTTLGLKVLDSVAPCQDWWRLAMPCPHLVRAKREPGRGGGPPGGSFLSEPHRVARESKFSHAKIIYACGRSSKGRCRRALSEVGLAVSS